MIQINAKKGDFMPEKLVSVIMPTYNCATFIGRTIASVQAQTYTQWELIIADDCSCDQTRDIVAQYRRTEPRIQYYALDTNSGASAARNLAMKMATGSYMAFLDADDIWMPDKLERQLSWMEENKHAFSCTSYEQIDEDDKALGKIVRAIPKTDYNRLLLDCPVGNSTVMYSVEDLGKFEVPDIRKRNDDALWLKMLKKEQYIWGMPDVLMRYRVRRASISSNKVELIRYHWILYRDIEKLGVLRSAFHVCYWCAIKLLGIK